MSDLEKIAVYSYRLWDPHRGVYFHPFDKRTEEGIERLGGNIVPGTAEMVESDDIVENGRYQRPD